MVSLMLSFLLLYPPIYKDTPEILEGPYPQIRSFESPQNTFGVVGISNYHDLEKYTVELRSDSLTIVYNSAFLLNQGTAYVVFNTHLLSEDTFSVMVTQQTSQDNRVILEMDYADKILWHSKPLELWVYSEDSCLLDIVTAYFEAGKEYWILAEALQDTQDIVLGIFPPNKMTWTSDSIQEYDKFPRSPSSKEIVRYIAPETGWYGILVRYKRGEHVENPYYIHVTMSTEMPLGMERDTGYIIWKFTGPLPGYWTGAYTYNRNITHTENKWIVLCSYFYNFPAYPIQGATQGVINVYDTLYNMYFAHDPWGDTLFKTVQAVTPIFYDSLSSTHDVRVWFDMYFSEYNNPNDTPPFVYDTTYDVLVQAKYSDDTLIQNALYKGMWQETTLAHLYEITLLPNDTLYLTVDPKEYYGVDFSMGVFHPNWLNNFIHTLNLEEGFDKKSLVFSAPDSGRYGIVIWSKNIGSVEYDIYPLIDSFTLEEIIPEVLYPDGQIALKQNDTFRLRVKFAGYWWSGGRNGSVVNGGRADLRKLGLGFVYLYDDGNHNDSLPNDDIFGSDPLILPDSSTQKATVYTHALRLKQYPRPVLSKSSQFQFFNILIDNSPPLIDSVFFTQILLKNGDSIRILADVKDTGEVKGIAHVYADVSSLSPVNTIELFDDGNHGDMSAGDGIYGSEIVVVNSPVTDSVPIKVYAYDIAKNYTEMTSYVIVDNTLPFISQYSPQYPDGQIALKVNDPFFFYVTIHDTGNIGNIQNAIADLSELGFGEMPLYDDGTHGDTLAGDGVYTLDTVIVSLQFTGTKNITVKAWDWVGNYAERSYQVEFDNSPPSFIYANVVYPEGQSKIKTGDTIRLITKIEEQGTQILRAFTLVNEVDTATDTLYLFDDGNHGDSLIGDGIYGTDPFVAYTSGNLYIYAYDGALNYDSLSKSVEVVPATAPVVNIVYPPDSAIITTVSFEMRVTVQDSEQIIAVYGEVDSSGQWFPLTYDEVSNIWKTTLTVSEGWHKIRAKAIDETQVEGVSLFHNFLVDVSNLVFIVYPIPSNYIGGEVTFKAATSANISEILFKFGGVLSWAGTVTPYYNPSTGYYEYTLNTALGNDGQGSLRVVVTTIEGIKDSTEATYNVDNTSPQISFNLLTQSQYGIYGDTTVAFEIVSNEYLDGIFCTVNGVPITLSGDTTYFTGAFITSFFGEGLLLVKTEGKDRVGNSTTIYDTVYVDLTQPIAAISFSKEPPFVKNETVTVYVNTSELLDSLIISCKDAANTPIPLEFISDSLTLYTYRMVIPDTVAMGNAEFSVLMKDRATPSNVSDSISENKTFLIYEGIDLFVLNPVDTLEEYKDYVIKVKGIDLKSLPILYYTINEKQNTLTLTQNGDIYIGTIPGEKIVLGELKYYLEAQKKDGSFVRSPDSGYHKAKIVAYINPGERKKTSLIEIQNKGNTKIIISLPESPPSLGDLKSLKKVFEIVNPDTAMSVAFEMTATYDEEDVKEINEDELRFIWYSNSLSKWLPVFSQNDREINRIQGTDTLIGKRIYAIAEMAVPYDNSILPYRNIIFAPNPVRNTRNVRIQFFYNSQAPKKVRVEIHDVSGNCLAVWDVNAKYGKNEVIWNIEKIPRGVYFVRFKIGGLWREKKLAIIK